MIFDPPSPHILLPAIRLKGKRKPLALAAHGAARQLYLSPWTQFGFFFFSFSMVCVLSVFTDIFSLQRRLRRRTFPLVFESFEITETKLCLP